MDNPHLDAYLRSRARRSWKTAATYGTAINALYDFAKDSERDALTTDVIVDFHGHLLDTVASSTAETYMAAVQGFIEYLEVVGEDVSHINRARIKYGVRNARQPQSFEHITQLDHLRKRDFPKLVDYFEHCPIPEDGGKYNERLTALRDIAIFWTLYETGARIGEVRRLDRHSVDRESRQAVVKGKGNRPHVLRFIGDRALDAIDAYMAEREDSTEALFVSHARNSLNKRLTYMSLYNAIKRPMKELGVDNRLSPHDIRHYRAIDLLRKGVPVHVIQTFLNHKNIDTTRQFYVPITDEADMLKYLSDVGV